MPVKQKEKENIDRNETVLQHFLLGILVFMEAIFKVLNLLLPSPESRMKNNNNFNQQKYLNMLITKKSNNELKNILNSVDITSSLNSNQIAKLLLSSPEAVQRLMSEERRSKLSQMTNIELRQLLGGVQGISRLKKSELIDIILLQESSKTQKSFIDDSSSK